MSVSIQDVTDGIDAFKNFSDQKVQSAIDGAVKQAQNDGISVGAFDMAVTQYAKYLLSMDGFMKYLGTISSSTFGNTQTRANLAQSNPYYQHYQQIVQSFGSGTKGSFDIYD